MSQTKAIVKTLEIPVDQIKPSPYQPRMTFNLEDIRGSIQRDGILVPLTVRKRDGDYELIDGERRTRLAKELGYKTVSVTVINVDDDTARRMVWKVNTLRQEYSPKEKAYYFKKLQDEYGMSLRGISRECDYGEQQVAAHLNVFKLPEKYQNLVWTGQLGISHIQELRPYFNGGASAEALIAKLDLALERKLTSMELRETIKPEIQEMEERRIEAAKEAMKKTALVPKEVKLETPEDFEEAAKVLRKEAKRRKTPKQIRDEKQKKTKDALVGKNSVASKIERAKELGIDTKWMEEEKEKIENKMPFQPDDALLDAKALKNQINEMIGNFQQEQKEAELRKKVEKEFKDKKKEEIKEELRKDETFKAELRTQLMKDMTSFPKVETLPVEIPEEEAKVLRERIEGQRQKMAEWINDPEIQKRGALFKNWVAHGAMLDVISSAFCPNDGPQKSTWKDLKWSCCGLSVEEAYDMLLKKLEKGR